MSHLCALRVVRTCLQLVQPLWYNVGHGVLRCEVTTDMVKMYETEKTKRNHARNKYREYGQFIHVIKTCSETIYASHALPCAHELSCEKLLL